MGSLETSPLNTEPGARVPLEPPRPPRSLTAEPTALIPSSDQFRTLGLRTGRAASPGLEAYATESPTRWSALLDVAEVLMRRGSLDQNLSTPDRLS